MKIMALLLVFLVVVLVVPVSGCTQQSITTQEQAQDTLKEVSTDVQELDGIFDEIDQALE